jgi:hypothetical protein
MRNGVPGHLVSAVIGGVIGAAVVLFVAEQKTPVFSLAETAHAQFEQNIVPNPPNGKFRDLEVENLIVTTQIQLRNKEGNPELFIRDGSVIAEKVILGNKLIGQQIQGHAIVGNRIFATPDNLVTTPQESWRFFAELGATLEVGGEIVVRNAAGAAVVGKQTTDGVVARMGFDTESRPQILALQNSDHRVLLINFDLSEEQKNLLKMLSPQAR